MTTRYREVDIKAITTAIKIISTICGEHRMCAGCPFEREDKDGYFDCILDKPPAEWDVDTITKCFTSH